MLVHVSPGMQAVGPPPEQQGCPIAPQVAQVPGIRIAATRPAQPSPIAQVPVLPVPQQG